MNTQDFDIIGKHVYENVDQINRMLGKAKFVSKFHSNEAGGDFPSLLQALVKKDDDLCRTKTVDTSEPSERPSEEDIDTLFETIRSNSAPSSKLPQRQGSFKKTTAAPLQHSRILNETNLAANGNGTTGSCSDLSGIANKTAIQSKQPTVDAEELIGRFRETIDSLAKIENGKIQSLDLMQCRQRSRSEWASIEKIARKVESLLTESKQKMACDQEGGEVKQEPLMSNGFIKSLKNLQSILHYTVYIKKSENLSDLNRTLSKEAFPLSECLDTIEETIRQKQL